MGNPGAAWPLGADLRALARRVSAARDDFLATGRLAATLRPVVAESWRRCAAVGLDPDGAAPPVELADADLEAYRSAHPLAAVMSVIRHLLVDDATESGLVVAVTDAAGRLLWVEGAGALRRRAENMHFIEGSLWCESVAGTNAPGTALALDHAVQIFAAEHLAGPVTPWTCVAAPVHGPDGRQLGAIDLTGGDDVAAPHAFGLVRAAAAAVESELRFRSLQAAAGRRIRSSRAARVGAARVGVGTGRAAGPPRLRVLGQAHGELTAHGEVNELRLRHAEILLLLSCHPGGLTAEQLAVELHEQTLAPVTLRAELFRLRELLGRLAEPQVESRPYRLVTPLTTDVDEVRQLVRQGDYGRALAAYRGPVLPASTAPGVEAIRERLRRDVRACLLASGDAELLWTFGQRPDVAHDLEVWQGCLRAMPSSSHLRPVVADRVRHLHEELGHR